MIFRKVRELPKVLPAVFWLARWLEHTKRGKVEKARSCLDKALARSAREFFIYAKPVEAIQFIGENRHDEARALFREVIQENEGVSDVDAEYLCLFCQFYECLYAEAANCNDHAIEAQKLDCSKSVRMLLRFPR